jgi:hypothetical protein
MFPSCLSLGSQRRSRAAGSDALWLRFGDQAMRVGRGGERDCLAIDPLPWDISPKEMIAQANLLPDPHKMARKIITS